MKKAVLLFLALALSLSLCACGRSDGGNKTFAARIDTAGESSLTVTPDVTSSEAKAADLFAVALTENTMLADADGNAVDRSFFTAGTQVEITYDGVIRESDPAQITALTMRLRNGVVSATPAPTEQQTSITFTVDGQTETVAADKVALDGASILVPADGWTSRSAEDTQVGPLVLSLEENSAVALTFRVHKDTAPDAVKALLAKQYPGIEWTLWDAPAGADSACSAAVISGGVSVQLFVAERGGDTVSILCRCPEITQGGWGAKLARIAATLTLTD